MGVLCVPADPGHLEVLHGACSKIPAFAAVTTPHSFTPPKPKAGSSHTCTVGNAHWGLMFNCLPFSRPVIEL